MLVGTLALLLMMSDPMAFVQNTAYARIPKANMVAGDPALVRFTVAQNAEGETLDQIRAKDREWIAQADYPLKATLTEGSCAVRLRELIADDSLIAEALLMDDDGALVCASSETSDYWQGDESKWQQTVAEGRDVFVDKPAFDDSTDTYAIQLSVPVKEGPVTIGALTLTLRLKNQPPSGGAARD